MKTWQLIGALIGLSIAVPIGCTYMTAATSVATAPARVLNKTMQTNNIIANYEYFRDASQTFEARKAQIAQYKGFFAVETLPEEKSRLRTEMAAIQQSCRDIAAEYNANTLKMNRNAFKGTNVPATLNSMECE
jgi:uncharacterized protein YukE